MRVVGRKVPIATDAKRVRPAGSEVRLLLCNYAKAQRLMDWTPRITLEAGLEYTARFIKDHPALYRPDEYAV